MSKGKITDRPHYNQSCKWCAQYIDRWDAMRLWVDLLAEELGLPLSGDADHRAAFGRLMRELKQLRAKETATP